MGVTKYLTQSERIQRKYDQILATAEIYRAAAVSQLLRSHPASFCESELERAGLIYRAIARKRSIAETADRIADVLLGFRPLFSKRGAH